jgi:hypothetical protein
MPDFEEMHVQTRCLDLLLTRKIRTFTVPHHTRYPAKLPGLAILVTEPVQEYF